MNTPKRLINGLLVLGMAAAAPLAFAQATPTDGSEPKAQSSAPPADEAAAAPTSTGQELSWADLDADGNGSLSAKEAQRHAGLANVFAQADADGNGELTADEYRGYLQQQGGAAQE